MIRCTLARFRRLLPHGQHERFHITSPSFFVCVCGEVRASHTRGGGLSWGEMKLATVGAFQSPMALIVVVLFEGEAHNPLVLSLPGW